MQTSRLDIVFEGIDVEDGARICAPNFEVFYQREEINKSRMNKKKKSQHQKSQVKVWKRMVVKSKHVISEPTLLQMSEENKGNSRSPGFTKPL